MTTNQLAYWANQEAIRSNFAREQENFRSNNAREAEMRRTNEANEQLKSQANIIARQNKTDELTVTKLIQTEANRLKAESNLNQTQANRIAAKRVSNDFDLGKTANQIKQQQTDSQESLNRTLSDLNRANIWYGGINAGANAAKSAASIIDAFIPF